MIISISTFTRKLNPGIDNEWGGYGPNGYVLLKPGANAAALEKKFPALLEKLNGREMKESKMIPTLYLEGFAYRIPVYWWIFAAAGLTAISVALLTISFQAIKAASTIPVVSLRSE